MAYYIIFLSLSPQEFECGVQFEGLEKNKQEWSFTLYDFDGHGKITREVTHTSQETQINVDAVCQMKSKKQLVWDERSLKKINCK